MQVAFPERCKPVSASHVGSSFRHKRTWVPPICRIPPPPIKKQPIPGSEELLYLALYRDKVAQVAKQQEELAHQAAAAARRRPPPAAVSPPRVALLGTTADAAAVAAAVASAMQFGHKGGEAGDTADGSTQGDSDVAEDAHLQTSAAVPPRWARGASKQRGQGAAGAAAAQAAGDPVPTPSTKRRGAARAAAAPDDAGPAHVASVTVRAAFGGVVSEYLETKQLGQLYDQWRASQEEKGEGLSPHSARHSRPGIGSAGSSARLPRGPSALGSAPPLGAPPASARATGSSSALDLGSDASGADPRSASAAGDRTPGSGATGPTPPGWNRAARKRATEAAEGSAGSGSEDGSSNEGQQQRSRAHVAEKRRAERLFSVLHNPKTRVVNFAERSIFDRDTRPAPSYIEGFPVLNLTRLYEGPWRMNV